MTYIKKKENMYTNHKPRVGHLYAYNNFEPFE